MKKIKEKGFTLIELIAVLVIMAVLALIVTPLVMNIIRKARISADKRSIDAYGRSIELAIAGYLLDTGKFPTEVSQLTIEYSGNKVECETTQINTDSSVYLAGCTVAGRSIEGYAYGSDKSPTYTAYIVGDQVTYNNVDYYVIKDSDAKESTVTLLKATPLTTEEVNTYGGVGTANNHVNMYTSVSLGEAGDANGFGAIAYYSSETCGYVNNTWVSDECKNDYASSEVKYVVDAWKAAQVPAATDARLITMEEFKSIRQYNWSYNNLYWYWTNTPYTYKDSTYAITEDGIWGSYVVFGILGAHGNHRDGGVVRPVIVLDKSVL